MSGYNDKAQQEREKYITAFNNTMLDIWREKIVKLGVIDTGALLQSLTALPIRTDGKFIEFTLSQEFLQYGLAQNYGTGKEVPIGNPGDIGRDKVREPRRWFSTKYYSSVMNLRDFLADNLGREFIDFTTNALDGKKFGSK